MIHVIAEIDINAGQRDAFMKEFKQVAPLVLAEDGCIEYGATIDARTEIERQAPLRNDAVTVVEKWSSVKALEAHLASEHMASFLEQVKDLVAGVTLRILEPA